MKVVNKIQIPPMSAKAFLVAKGQTLRIIDQAGKQPGDFVAFQADDLSVKFSQARTRVENRRTWITEGHSLWTDSQPPAVLFTVTKDTAGRHDLLYTPCCRYALETRFGVSRDGCHENLAKALEPWGLSAHDIPAPLNLFFNVSVDSHGLISIQEPTSASGAAIDLRAEMNTLVAIATCSVPLTGKENTAYQIEILE